MISDQTLKGLIRRTGAKVKEMKVETMVITIERVIKSEVGITVEETTSTRVTMVKEIIVVDPMFYLKILKLLLRMVDVV